MTSGKLTISERLEYHAEQLGMYQTNLKLWTKQRHALVNNGFEVTEISKTKTHGLIYCKISWENAKPNTQAGNLRKWADEFHAKKMHCPEGVLT